MWPQTAVYNRLRANLMPPGQSTEAPCNMTTKLMHSEDPDALLAVRRVLAAQACFAMPTDTVYGLCADPRGNASVQSLFAAKGRPESKAIPVLLGSLAQLPEIAARAPAAADQAPG